MVNFCAGAVVTLHYEPVLALYHLNKPLSLFLSQLAPSLTDANCHSDIFPGDICPSDICPYQEYLSYCLPHFDQTLKLGFWDHL